MTPRNFVEGFYREKQDFLRDCLSVDSRTEVSSLIQAMELNVQQAEILEKVLDSAFSEIFYEILLGLDGCTSIGGLLQQQFTVLDENNDQVCGRELSGEIELLAFEFFHEKK